MRSANTSKVNIPQAITNADVIGPELDLTQMYMYAMQAVWVDSGSLAGTVKLQATIDGVTWSDVASSSATVTGSDSYLWNVIAAAYSRVRPYFTYSAGAGTIDFNAQTKGP